MQIEQSEFISILTCESKDKEALLKLIGHSDFSSHDRGQTDSFSDFLVPLKKTLQGSLGLILKLGPDWEYPQLMTLYRFFGEQLGTLLEQNEKGDQVIHVYDRGREGSIFNGARYHQTREGGSIHTDNVNTPDIWEYLLLGCLEKAESGGENILVNGPLIYEKLKHSFPEALKILQDNFIWEMRGLSQSLYEAPIITLDENQKPLFRHLRPYMESAHLRAEKPLTLWQLYALDTLDALTGDSKNQLRVTMEKGDMLITYDAKVLHGRSCFSDAIETQTIENYRATLKAPLRRTMERLWIKK
jgi:alpha-ketoglutarate-dependent taurine dioxygenase